MATEKKKTRAKTAQGSEASFDVRLARLEEIVQEMEEGGLGLEDGLERYREGVGHLKGCRELLVGYRRQVEELTRGAEAALEPYEEDPDVPAGD